MPSSIKKILDRFPFPTIDPVVGTPGYESITDIHLKLNSNAALVQSNLGCDTLGDFIFDCFASRLRHIIHNCVFSAS